MADLEITAEPFLGLRPFEEADRRFFCGRRAHVGAMLERLDQHRFVAVVGLSGSGKSSLVRAGVIPELRADRLKRSSSDWLIVMITPEASPSGRLVAELVKETRKYGEAHGLPTEPIDAWATHVAETIDASSNGIVKAIEQAGLSDRTRVLLVVDQFEELLFRYRLRSEKDQAAGFIKRLLKAATDPNPKIYVVITMRSEYLGDCAAYQGLAEAVNAGLYLTPRLGREQLLDTITIPAEKCYRTVDALLVNRLVNDVANDQDQLPVLQHALMRCWQRASGSAGNGVRPIDLALYDEIGGTHALNDHAESVLDEFRRDADQARGARNLRLAERLFKRITKPGSTEGVRESEKDGVRDPARLDVICRQIGFLEAEVTEVINAFRRSGRDFLRPTESVELSGDCVIDITHESFIRKWQTLQGWIRAEAESAAAYLRLLNEAETQGTEGVLREREISSFLRYQESGPWTKEWAERYGGDYQKAIDYLHRSQEHYRELERQKLADQEDAVRQRELDAEQRHQDALAAARKNWNRNVLRAVYASIGLAVILLTGFLTVRFFRDRQTQRATSFERSRAIFTPDQMTAESEDALFAVLEAAWISAQEPGQPALDIHALASLDQWESFGRLGTITRWRNGVGSQKDADRATTERQAATTASTEPTIGFRSSSFAVSADGELVALADQSRVVVWSLKSGVPTPHFEARLDGVNRVRFSPTGRKLIASAVPPKGSDPIATIHMFDIADSTSGALAAVLHDAPTSTTTRVRLADNSKAIVGISFVDESRVAVLSERGSWRVFSEDESEITLERNTPTPANVPASSSPPRDALVRTAAFSPDGQRLFFSAGADGGLVALASAESQSTAIHLADGETAGTDAMTAGAFDNSSRVVAIGTDTGRISVWSTDGQNLANGRVTGQEIITSIAVRTQGPVSDSISEVLVAVGTQRGLVQTFRWGPSSRTPDGRPSPSLEPVGPPILPSRSGLTDEIRWIDFGVTPDALVIASGEMTQIFDYRLGIELTRARLERPPVFALQLANTALLTALDDGGVRLDETRSTSVISQKAIAGCSPSEMSAVATSGVFVWGCGGTMHWKSGEPAGDSGARVTSFSFSENGERVAWIHPHQTNQEFVIHTQHFPPGAPAAGRTAGTEPIETQLRSNNDPSLAISPDGRWLAAGFDTQAQTNDERAASRVLLYQASTSGEPFQRQSHEITLYGQITSMAIDNNGAIAIGDSEGLVHLFAKQAEDWPESPVAKVGNKKNPPSAVAFAEPSRVLVALSDGTIGLVPFGGQSPALAALKWKQRPFRSLVFKPGGQRFAAIWGPEAIIFDKENGSEFKQTLRLREPGEIVSLAFTGNDGLMTSLRVKDARSLPVASVALTHSLDFRQNIRNLCENLPLTDASKAAPHSWSLMGLGQKSPEAVCSEITKAFAAN